MNPKSGKACKLEKPTAPTVAKEADKADPGGMSQVKPGQAPNNPAQAAGSPPSGFRSGGGGGGGGASPGGGPSGSSPGPGAGPNQPADKKEEKKKVWVSIELLDAEDNPVAGAPYEIKVPNETQPRKGSLDGNGKARIDGIDPGNCEVCFPEIHASEWKKISSGPPEE